jgi:hypothetical protein
MADRYNLAHFLTAILLLTSFVAASAAQRRENIPAQPSNEARQSDETARRDSSDRPRNEGRRIPRDGMPPPPASSMDVSPREFRGPGGPGFFRGYEPPTEAESKNGFLFINGEYIPPPYQLRLAENALTVNGHALECLPPQRGYGGYGGRGFGSRPGEPSWRYMLSEVLTQLGSDLVILCFKDQPYVVLDGGNSYELLKTMTMEHGRSVRQLTVREQLPDGFDKAVWDEWIESFDPPGDMLQRAAVLVNNFETAQRQAEADMRATKLLNQSAYPLAVGGMVLSVLAIGHLLGGRPHARQRLEGRDESLEMIHSLNWSLLFVAAFSLLDLTWTVLAANAGQMQELNPIGSHLVENPRHLIGFKVGITLPSLALIWLLRKHKRAQAAAWWLCLVLTFVTLRWLMISPLMAPV